MNHGGEEVWVNLLGKGGSSSHAVMQGHSGVTVTPNTPRVMKRISKTGRVESQQVEVLRSQIVTLLKEKQELAKKVEKSQKERFQRELATVQRSNSSDMTISSNNANTSHELQIASLHDALSQVTREKDGLKDKLAMEAARAARLQSQLAKEQDNFKENRNGHNLPKELNAGSQDSAHHKSSAHHRDQHQVILELNMEVASLEASLALAESERDALKERLTAAEVQRQTSLEQYQQEVETSVQEVTSQLEELLQLNQQLQQELSSLQEEKDEVTTNLAQATKQWETEKQQLHHKLANSEHQLSSLTSHLQLVKTELVEQTTSSLSTMKSLQNQLDEANAFNSQLSAQYKTCQSTLEQLQNLSEQQQTETDRTLPDLQHQLVLLQSEKSTLGSRLQSTQTQHAKLKEDAQRLEGDNKLLNEKFCSVQREKATLEAQLVTLTDGLSNKEQEIGHLKKEFKDTKGFLQSHSRQQVENLTQQLVQRSNQLQEADADKRQLQQKVQKLESKLQELESSQHQDTIIRASNTQLQQKVMELEGEVEKQRKQLAEKERLLNENFTKIQELDNMLQKLQEEKEGMMSRLSLELQHSKTSSGLESQLRDENTRLQELLTTSLSLNETLQASLEQSSAHSSPVKSTSVSFSDDLRPSPSSSLDQLEPARHSHSPHAEVVHLKQQLAKAHEASLRLEMQHSQDKTEMAKVQGSLQALICIQDHLKSENKSFAESIANLEAEKDAYKREAMKLSNDLITAQDGLQLHTTRASRYRSNLLESCQWLQEKVSNSSDLHTKLQDYCSNLDSMQDSEVFSLSNSLLEALNSEVLSLQQQNKVLSENLTLTEGDCQGKEEELYALELKVKEICQQLKTLKEELSRQEEIIREKDDMLERYEAEIQQIRQDNREQECAREEVEVLRKDLEAQYQAKLAVLRNNLVEKEKEALILQTREQELQSLLRQTNEEIDPIKEELSLAKSELQIVRDRLVRSEAAVESELTLLNKETERQGGALSNMKLEVAEIEESNQVTCSVNDAHKDELRESTQRISQLQTEVEMLRARKAVIVKYLQSSEQTQGEMFARERDEVISDNEQLALENDQLRQELVSLNETTQHLNEEVEILALRLQEVNEDYERDKKLLQEQQWQEIDGEIHRVKMELEAAQGELKHHCSMLEAELEAQKIRYGRLEQERDGLKGELSTLMNQLGATGREKRDEIKLLQQRIQERDAVIRDMQTALDQTVSERENLEVRLNESLSTKMDGSLFSNRKVDKLKQKLKQQIRQTNHQRTKLGYALSELRLYKQLKLELDTQIRHLKQSLSLSHEQYQQCLNKLYQAEQLHPMNGFSRREM